MLIEPFKRIANYKHLIDTLNEAIVSQHRLTANLLTDRDSVGGQLSEQPDETVEADNDELDELGLRIGRGEINDQANKENLLNSSSPIQNSSSSCLIDRRRRCLQRSFGPARPALNFLLMNRRQIISILNGLFLSELKSNLIERAHEFTDCAYTKHEHRETILLLIDCIKLLLNKLVKLLYRLVSSSSSS